jgi:hypothetical protein
VREVPVFFIYLFYSFSLGVDAFRCSYVETSQERIRELSTEVAIAQQDNRHSEVRCFFGEQGKIRIWVFSLFPGRP